MSELSTAKPTGWTNSAASTGPEFNVFVLSTVPELQQYDGAGKATMTRPPRRSSEQSSAVKLDLEPLMGVYESSDRKRIAVIASDGILTAVSVSEPGQPAYRLEPMAADSFHLEGMPEGFIAQFDLKDGKPAGLTLLRGSFGSIVFRRLR